MNTTELRSTLRAPIAPSPLPVDIAQAATASLVWRDICARAEDAARQEPFLSARLQALVLERASLGASIAAVLARRLAGADMPEAALRALMEEVLAGAPRIAQQAAADLAAVKERDPACPDMLHVLLNLKGFQALQAYRVAHALWRDGRDALAFALSNQASIAFAVDIHPAARIGCGVMFDHGTGIVIGETTVVEDHVSILQNVTLGGTGKEHGDRHPKIRSGVMIGAGAKILGNIEVGAMSKVAAGSVVLRPVPAHCTVAGVPARVVRHHHDQSCPSDEMDQSI
ncbi:MAG TPA: serine O-acetyltransferase [Noviherbaspirillum sp.]|uniref:serine O-acetyltransferase n=1 Tax=Noviherbaspirillum sp. TaxID=1926288 RepID=UPI002D4D7253|nr:serine O-acetyltransferase [Noviherbaspirillum sp.]HYD96654.1 serine O-acetyltransferase [Noviherbaspirillum sp.]